MDIKNSSVTFPEHYEIIDSGKGPIFLDEFKHLTHEDKFLLAAYVYGLKVGIPVYRYSLFAFIQAYVAVAHEEPLQRTVENSAYWRKIGIGLYGLNQSGYIELNKLIKDFDIFDPGYISPDDLFIFEKSWRDRKFIAIVNPANQKINIYVDGVAKKGVEVDQLLQSLGATFQIKSSTKTSKVLNWILQSGDYEWQRLSSVNRQSPSFCSPSSNSSAHYTYQDIPNEDEELSFPEGSVLYKLHRLKERNSSVIKLAKRKAFRYDPLLKCHVCQFSFVEAYGEIGQGFIEAHHVIPVSQLDENSVTHIEDIVLVCSNCHKMLHRRRPWLTAEDIQSIFDSLRKESSH